jgi:hypothetical protein
LVVHGRDVGVASVASIVIGLTLNQVSSWIHIQNDTLCCSKITAGLSAAF